MGDYTSDGEIAREDHDSRDEEEPYGVVGIDELSKVLDPYKCIVCTSTSDFNSVNSICLDCKSSFDGHEQFLHKNALELFNFSIALRRRYLWDTVWTKEMEGTGYTGFGFFKGGIRDTRTLPKLDHIVMPPEIGTSDSYQRCLSNHEQELLDQCLLALGQCHFSLILLPDLMESVFLNDPASLVRLIEEVQFEPYHEHCTEHFIYRLTFYDGRRFALSLTDRQLGWIHIVRPWSEYHEERIYRRGAVRELGEKRLSEERWPQRLDLCREGTQSGNNELQILESIRLSKDMVRCYEDWRDGAWGE